MATNGVNVRFMACKQSVAIKQISSGIYNYDKLNRTKIKPDQNAEYKWSSETFFEPRRSRGTKRCLRSGVVEWSGWRRKYQNMRWNVCHAYLCLHWTYLANIHYRRKLFVQKWRQTYLGFKLTWTRMHHSWLYLFGALLWKWVITLINIGSNKAIQ